MLKKSSVVMSLIALGIYALPGIAEAKFLKGCKSHFTNKADRRACTNRCENAANVKKCINNFISKNDADEDGIAKGDNCANRNPDQLDGNSDGVGDACNVIDVAVAGRNNNSIDVFRDVLNGDKAQVPSAVIFPTFGDAPRSVEIVNNRLYAGSRSSGINIWNDVASLNSGDSPDVELFSSPCGLSNVFDIQVVNNDLYATARDNYCVNIFRDVTTLASGDNPDTTLGSGPSNMYRPRQLAVVGDTLFVGRQGDDDDDDAAGVLVFHNASTLATDAVPDAIIPTGNYFGIRADGNRLYLAGWRQTDTVQYFDNAESLTSSSIPTGTIIGTAFVGGDKLVRHDLETPWQTAFVHGTNDRVCVSNRYVPSTGDDDDDDDSNIPLQSPCYNISKLTGGATDTPDAQLVGNYTEEIQSVGNTLFYPTEEFSAVFVYFSADTATTGQLPDKILIPTSVSRPKRVAAATRS